MWIDEGEGDSQMTILLFKPYFVKVTTKGGGSKYPKILPCGLCMTPKGNMGFCTIIQNHIINKSGKKVFESKTIWASPQNLN